MSTLREAPADKNPGEALGALVFLFTLSFVFLVLPVLAIMGAPPVVCLAAVGTVGVGALASLMLST
jgi:hypothetical protein